MQSTLRKVTQAMVGQANGELQRHATFAPGGSEHTIDLKVTYLRSTYVFHFYKSQLTFTASLGDGTTFEKTVDHTTGLLYNQDLNGCVADSVGELLDDERVVASLKR